MIHLMHRHWKNYVTNNSVTPPWIKNTQVSGCPGLVNYATEGIVILADDDYEFETKDGTIIPWNHHAEMNLPAHFYEQANMRKPGHTICKFNTGIFIKHSEKERLLCLVSDYDPLHTPVRVMPATLPILDVWTPVLLNTVYLDGHHFVEKGQPLARMIISYASKFEFSDDGESPIDIMDEWLKIKKAGDESSALSVFNKELKKCPFHSGK